MTDMIYQAVGHAFVKSATVMGNTIHNAVVKTFADGPDELCSFGNGYGSSFVGSK